ncbi:MAG: D-alanyl-D-alanine carboxypeptidase, partial [Verrucomicrobia bacterium]|nr:D-alanyl-D-alanine carboxypeptidase [Verrucomicrobiota bacterium]
MISSTYWKCSFKTSRSWKLFLLVLPIFGSALIAQAVTHTKSSSAKKQASAPVAAESSKKTVTTHSRDPYYGAVVIDAATGAILQEDHASAVSYPASMVKLMTLFVLLDDVNAGKIRLDESITISREVAKIGARQVWLKEGEVFPLEELIYAMMIHSANDAAAALAIRASGSCDAHAARMTAKAKELGLRNTVFHNVHGLPPEKGQEPDVTSALDMALLAKTLLERHPETLKYSSIETRPFRPNTTNMVQLTTSNKLLGKVPGCDGLKTGYYFDAGFSTTATAQRDGRRVIAVVLGSKDKHVRDAKAAELIESGFAKLPPLPPPAPIVIETNLTAAAASGAEEEGKSHTGLISVLIGA